MPSSSGSRRSSRWSRPRTTACRSAARRTSRSRRSRRSSSRSWSRWRASTTRPVSVWWSTRTRSTPSGETTIDWYRPSPDGSRVAVSLSEHGTEDGTVYVYDAATGETVGEPLPHVNSGMSGGSLAWRADSGGFWCTWTRRRGLLSGGVVSRARHRRWPAGARGRLRRRPDRRELPVGVARRALGAGPRPEGGRRGVADLRAPAAGRCRLADDRRSRRRVRSRGVRRPVAVPSLAARRPARAGAAPRARRRGDRRRCDGGRAGGRARDRGDRGERRSALGGGHRRRPVGAAGLRPRRERPAGAGAAGDQLDRRAAQARRRGGRVGGGDVRLAALVVGPRRRRRRAPPHRAGHDRADRLRRHRGRARARDLQGRHAGPHHPHVPDGNAEGRLRPGGALRLRRLRDLAQAVVPAVTAAVARAGRRVRRREPPRRRRVRPRMASRRAARRPSRTASTTSRPAPTTSCGPA